MFNTLRPTALPATESVVRTRVHVKSSYIKLIITTAGGGFAVSAAHLSYGSDGDTMTVSARFKPFPSTTVSNGISGCAIYSAVPFWRGSFQ